MCLFGRVGGEAGVERRLLSSLCRRSGAERGGSAGRGQVRGEEGGHGASPAAVQQEQQPQPDHARRAQHQGEGRPRIHAGTVFSCLGGKRSVRAEERAWVWGDVFLETSLCLQLIYLSWTHLVPRVSSERERGFNVS